MADVEITKRPSVRVAKLSSPVRLSNSRKMKATWKVPAALKSGQKNDRATGLEIEWILGITGKDPKKVIETDNQNRTSHTINLSNLKIGSKTYTRNSFYPLTKKKLTHVTVKVTPTNGKGKGKPTSETRKFEKPKKPSIGAFTFNTETGRVETTIKTDAGNGYRERYDTRYTVTIENTRTGKTWNSADSHSTSTSFTVGYDVSDYQQLSYDDYVKVTVTAWSRGYAGKSEPVSKPYYVSYPAQAEITDIAISGRSSSDKCTVLINTGSSDEHPVDRVRLDYLPNSEYATAETIPADAAWTESNIIDNKNCKALSIPVANVIPERGRYTWVRVTSWHANEEILYRYSNYKNIEKLEEPAPTAVDDEIKILSAVAGANGQSAIVLLGWNADGQDDSTGTELTWDTDKDAWRSTESPDEYLFDWSDGELTYDNVTYQDSATITIKGLDEGVNYYIHARRYLDNDGDITYSNPSEAVCLTSDRPESVVATVQKYVPINTSLGVRWTFSGNSLQKSWQIIDDRDNEYSLTEDEEVVSGKTYYERSGTGTAGDPYTYTVVSNPQDKAEDIATWYELTYQNGTVIDQGEGSTGFAMIPASRLLDFATNNTVTFTVQVSTGSGYVVSEPVSVTVIDNPTLTVDAADILTEQPYSFDVTASSLCDLIVIVTSQGAAGQMPQGFRIQAEGDTIHSDVYTPEWTEENGEFTDTVILPVGLDFWDLGQYSLSVVAIDRTTGLHSEESLSEFSVDWDNKAVNPENAVSLTVIDTTDEEGYHRQAVQIDLTPPENSNQTDVYDIYRMDIENPSLIGEGFPLTFTTVDEYAPFGDDLTLRYRIALRTIDGDVEFADIDYTAQCENMRFDWSGGPLELHYGLQLGDSFKKDTNIRQHMDGSSDAYWNPNIERKSTLNSDVIRIKQPRDIERARLLARYAGAVFVRLPNGSAFEADVQVTDLSKKNDAVVSIALDATEIGLTQEFILPTPFEYEEPEEEEE